MSDIIKGFTSPDDKTYTPISTQEDPISAIQAGIYGAYVVQGMDGSVEYILQPQSSKFSGLENVEWSHSQIDLIDQIARAHSRALAANVALIGPPGSGKTTMISAIANRAMIQDHPVIMFDYIPSGGEMREWVMRVGDTPCVFIVDELASRTAILNNAAKLETKITNSGISGVRASAMHRLNESFGARSTHDYPGMLDPMTSFTRTEASNTPIDKTFDGIMGDPIVNKHMFLMSLFDRGSLSKITNLTHVLDMAFLLDEVISKRLTEIVKDHPEVTPYVSEINTMADLHRIESRLQLASRGVSDIVTLLSV